MMRYTSFLKKSTCNLGRIDFICNLLVSYKSIVSIVNDGKLQDSKKEFDQGWSGQTDNMLNDMYFNQANPLLSI